MWAKYKLSESQINPTSSNKPHMIEIQKYKSKDILLIKTTSLITTQMTPIHTHLVPLITKGSPL